MAPACKRAIWHKRREVTRNGTGSLRRNGGKKRIQSSLHRRIKHPAGEVVGDRTCGIEENESEALDGDYRGEGIQLKTMPRRRAVVVTPMVAVAEGLAESVQGKSVADIAVVVARDVDEIVR